MPPPPLNVAQHKFLGVWVYVCAFAYMHLRIPTYVHACLCLCMYMHACTARTSHFLLQCLIHCYMKLEGSVHQ